MPPRTPNREEDLKALIRRLRHDRRPDGVFVHIPAQLERPLYLDLDRILRFAGGHWNTAKEAHRFPVGTDTPSVIESAFASAAHIDDNPRDFFPTAGDVADDMATLAIDDYQRFCIEEHPDHRIRVLEPSIGRASLIKALYRTIPAAKVDLVSFEIDNRHYKTLATLGISPRQQDFLAAPVEAPVDIVLMNPPFAVPGIRTGWAAHITRALQWLKPGGRLVAVVPALIDHCDSCRKDSVVLDIVAQAHANGEISRIRDRAFAGNGKSAPNTNVATRLITIEPPLNDDAARCNGWSNRWTWATALIIDNNDCDLREQAIHGGSPRVLSTQAAIAKRLLAQRPQWIQHGAPWLVDHVDLDEIADHLHSVAQDIMRHYDVAPALPPDPVPPPPPRKARSSDAAALLPLFDFADRADKAA